MAEDAVPVPVVCALIERDGLVLLAQRPAHKHLGSLWEFPGGKVEAGEDHPSALKREIMEELGCDIDLVHALAIRTHTYGAVTVAMIPFVARLASGSPAPRSLGHSAIAWVAPRDLAARSLAPADLPIVDDYLQWLSARPGSPHR